MTERCTTCHKKVSLVDAIAFACNGCKGICCLSCKLEHSCKELELLLDMKKQKDQKKLLDEKTVAEKLKKD